jgi:hypothetical protein
MLRLSIAMWHGTERSTNHKLQPHWVAHSHTVATVPGSTQPHGCNRTGKHKITRLQPHWVAHHHLVAHSHTVATALGSTEYHGFKRTG